MTIDENGTVAIYGAEANQPYYVSLIFLRQPYIFDKFNLMNIVINYK